LQEHKAQEIEGWRLLSLLPRVLGVLNNKLAAVDPAQAHLMVPKWAYSTSQPKK
jgi:hypothetical protein